MTKAQIVLTAVLTGLVCSGQDCSNVQRPRRVVFFGDSIANSSCATMGSTSIVGAWQRIRSDLLIIQYARDGCCVAATPDKCTWMQCSTSGASYVSHDAIVFEHGTNDYALQIPLNSFRTAYEADLDQFATKRRYCMLPLWRLDESTRPIPLDSYRQIIIEECQARSLPVLDPREALPPGATEYYCDALRIHPTDAGNVLLAAWLAGVVEVE